MKISGRNDNVKSGNKVYDKNHGQKKGPESPGALFESIFG